MDVHVTIETSLLIENLLETKIKYKTIIALRPILNIKFKILYLYIE